MSISFTDEHHPFAQTYTVTRDGRILATGVRPKFKAELEALIAAMTQALPYLKSLADFDDPTHPATIDYEAAEDALTAITGEGDD